MRQATASVGSLVEGDAPDCRLMHHHPTDRQTDSDGPAKHGPPPHQDNWTVTHRHQPTVHPTTNNPCTTYLLVYSSDVCAVCVCVREHFTCLARRLHCQPATATQHSTVQQAKQAARCQIQPPTGDTRGALP